MVLSVIRNIADLEAGAVLQADVGIVGAGLAGIDVARYLGRQGLRVALLESGRLEFDPAIQELARVAFAGKPQRTHETHGHITAYLPPMYRGYCRIRQFGGTTNVWTGKWRIFDAADFEERPWIPYSGWPIKLDDLLPFYEETALDYALGDFGTESGSEFVRETRQWLAPVGLEPHLFYWEKTATRSGTRFFQELKDAVTVDVVLGATATEIVLDDHLQHVRAVVFQSLDGRKCSLEARHFVLAAGGLEVPRLLLASNRQVPAGVGNARDLVGRFYMDHPKDMEGRLRPGHAFKRVVDGVRTRPRPRFGVSFSFTGEVQGARSLLNHALYVRDPVRPFRGGPVSYFPVKLGVEQAPNRNSRVYLGSKRDSLGMPQLIVDWQFTPLDHETLALLVSSLTKAFAEVGLGRLDFGSRALRLDDMMDASHHMGATRMAGDPSTGVVDRNCKVFDVDNLFIASSSVFPTAHAYSPTYTILAMARRLGRHLDRCARAGRGAAPGAAHAKAFGADAAP
jgi:choline dehydrogenase-like flavoprotein